MLAVVLLLALVAAVVGYPLLRPARSEDATAGDDLLDLEARKQSKYREIRDAEMDFRSGKLSQDDYRRVDGDLRREAIEILRQIDKADQRPGGS